MNFMCHAWLKHQVTANTKALNTNMANMFTQGVLKYLKTKYYSKERAYCIKFKMVMQYTKENGMRER